MKDSDTPYFAVAGNRPHLRSDDYYWGLDYSDDSSPIHSETLTEEPVDDLLAAESPLAIQALQPTIYPFNKGLIALSLHHDDKKHSALNIGRLLHNGRAYDIWFVEYKSGDSTIPRLYCCHREDPELEDGSVFHIDVIGFRRRDYQEKAIEEEITEEQIDIALRGLDLLDKWAMRNCMLQATYKIS